MACNCTNAKDAEIAALRAEAKERGERIEKLEAALESLLAALDQEGTPGYLGDESGWECGECTLDGRPKFPTVDEARFCHEEDCFQGKVELAQAALMSKIGRP